MRMILAGVLAVALASCGGGDDAEDGVSGGTYQRTVDVGDEGGKMDTRVGGDIEVDLPAGFSVYPGAKVIATNVVTLPQGKGRTVFMQSQDPVGEVADYYRKQATDAGIEFSNEMNSGDTQLLAGTAPSGTSMNIMVATNDEGTTIQLTVSEGAPADEG